MGRCFNFITVLDFLICGSRLFHSFMVEGKKDFFKKSCFVRRWGIFSYLPSYHIYLLSRLVVSASEELSSSKKLTSKIWFPPPGSPYSCMAGWSLGLPYLVSLSGLVCLLLFTFVLVLTFCSVKHAFEFRFIASSLAIVFVSALNCACLHI